MARPIRQKQGEELPTTGQSNYLTTAKYDYTPQEKRILYRVVEQAWKQVQEQEITLKDRPVAELIFQDKTFRMPITSFMNKDQLKNRGGNTDKEVYDAFLSLRAKDISGRNSVNGTWMVSSIVNSAYKFSDGMITFSVAGPVWQSALDFSTGWSPLELTIAMELKSAYSMRFFELARQYHNTGIWIVSIDEFREYFGCTEKYTAHNDLKRYVIDNAQKELDKSSPISFTYEQKKQGKRVIGLTFHFHKTGNEIGVQQEKKQLMQKHPSAILDPMMKEWLTRKLNLNQQERNSNIKLWDALQQQFGDRAIDEMEETYQWIARQGHNPADNIGWVIQNLNAKLANAKDGQEPNPDGQQRLDAIRNLILNK